jgi:hypothetical protein
MSKKILSEQETRKNMLEIARSLGCEGDVIELFAKYDKLMNNCTNVQELQAISVMGNIEIHRLLSSDPGELIVGNKIIK